MDIVLVVLIVLIVGWAALGWFFISRASFMDGGDDIHLRMRIALLDREEPWNDKRQDKK